MNKEKISSMKETFLTIQKYLANEEWVSKQDDDILNAIRQCEGIVADVTTHLYIFVNYFEQYVQAITDSPLFGNGDADDKNDNISTGPTQTPAPANRAEKRAATKKQPEPIVP